MRDSYTNRNHSPAHEMWSYERDGRWRGWSFVRGSTVSPCPQAPSTSGYFSKVQIDAIQDRFYKDDTDHTIDCFNIIALANLVF